MKGTPHTHVPVEGAVDRVGAVARALTSTTGGVAELQREVVCTAASIAGDGAAASAAQSSRASGRKRMPPRSLTP